MSSFKVAGHPVHPMLIVFPLGLFATSVIVDFIYWGTRGAGYAFASYVMIGGGIIGAAAAAIFGTIDWLRIPNGTRAKNVGLWHGITNVFVLLLFIGSFWIRSNQIDRLPTITATVLAVLAIALGVVAGWLGGELVDRLGIGVDPGAHANAPSSLSKRPATDQDEPPPRRPELAPDQR